MAHVTIAVDTVAKKMDVMMDGKKMDNVMRVECMNMNRTSYGEKYNEEEEDSYGCNIVAAERKDGYTQFTHIMASKAGVETKEEKVYDLQKEITEFFKKK